MSRSRRSVRRCIRRFSVVYGGPSRVPADLEYAMLLAWLPLPLLAAVSSIFYSRLGAPYLLAAVVAVNPYTVLFAISLRTELLFTAVLIAALLLLDDRPIAAGFLASVTYVTRTAGVAVIVAAIAMLLWRREYRKAIRFTAGVAPFVLAWTWWTSASSAYRRSKPAVLHRLFTIWTIQPGLGRYSSLRLEERLGNDKGIGGLVLVDADHPLLFEVYSF